jgi:hypothetical protein
VARNSSPFFGEVTDSVDDQARSQTMDRLISSTGCLADPSVTLHGGLAGWAMDIVCTYGETPGRPNLSRERRSTTPKSG